MTPRPPRARHGVVRTVIAVTAIVIGGCSSGTDAPAAGSTTDVPTTAAPTTDAPTTVATSTTVAAPTWCDAARDVRTASEAVDAVDFADPVALEGAMTDLVERTQAALDVAPAGLADDVQLTLDGMIAFRDELEAVDYDFLEADLGVLADPDGSMQAAGDRIEQYNSDECGIPPDDDDEDGEDPGFDPEAGSVRDQIIAALVASGLTVEEAECLFGEIDFADREQTEDRELISAAFETCGIDPSLAGP